MKLRTLWLASLIGLLWSAPMACRMKRQRHHSTQSERHTQHTDHPQHLQHTWSMGDSRGYRFYLLTDSPFFFHADSGLYARSGVLLLDQQEQKHRKDSMVMYVQETNTTDAEQQTKEDERTRITSGYCRMDWRAWLVMMLLCMWFVWWVWKRVR